MRLTCPICGARDLREFHPRGAAVLLARPDPEASEADWDDYLHRRDNPAGQARELWMHEGGCGAWLVVERNTVSHAVHKVALALREPS